MEMEYFPGARLAGGATDKKGGASYATVERGDRKGFAPYFSTGDVVGRRVVGQRIFTATELFEIYRICPDIRAPIDLIRLRIAGTPWVVQPTMRKVDPDYESAVEIAAAVTAFLTHPNVDEDWTTFAGKWTSDALIYDAFATERVRSTKGQLQELVCWRGGDITPMQDEHGHVFAYRQDLSSGGTVRFLPEDMDYGCVFANTTYPDGQPIIETLMEEFITMRASTTHFRRAVDADEVPPGFLALMGVADIAFKRFETSMKAKTGRDDLLRMVALEETGGKVEWIPLTRSMKDLDWMPNVKETRKTIWRLFGVSPVTMGETDNVPRASAEVQVDETSNRLIGPLEERLAKMVNERWIPLIVGNLDLAGLVQFRWDHTPKLSQKDQKDRAERLSTLVGAKILSNNEAREELGYDPVDEAEADKVTDGGSDGADEAADQDAEASRPRAGRRQAGRWSHPAPRQVRGRGPVTVFRGSTPSDWQPTGRFRGRRTVPLSALADLVGSYEDAVTPLYLLCARNVLRVATDAVADGVLTAAEGTKIVSSVARETEALVRDWNADTEFAYLDAAQMGADAAVEWGGEAIPWRSSAATYQASAIGYLTGTSGTTRGLITTLRQDVSNLVLQMLAAPVPTRPKRTDGRADDSPAKLPAALGAFLEALRAVFERNQHRIGNWSGRLVELANQTASESLRRAEVKAAASDPIAADPWYVDWVEVADRATCETCRAEGAKPIRPLTELRTVPGGATECGAKCRCVLVFHKKSEVEDGTAKKLGPVRSRWARPPLR